MGGKFSVPTFVVMESELTEALFLPGELLDSPAIRTLVFLPINESPSSAEMNMLERMLEAMGWSQEEWRYLYHQGFPEWTLVEEKEAVILFFASLKGSPTRPERLDEGHGTWYSLPSLGMIQADNSLKRAVWDLIKP